jgi:polysaccharide pyruvyl transferase WcaK-like protein
MCRRYCGQSLIITRNEESQRLLGELDISTELGTDTAWTFEPLSLDYGRKVLRDAGWDEHTPVLVLCPINPFWWPVKASLLKSVALAFTGAYKESHYRAFYFHNSGSEVQAAYKRYLTALASAVAIFCKKRRVFPLLVAMERLDARACEWVADRLGGAPVLTSDQYDMYQLVSVLRACHLMVSSRYHGIVTAMPGLVPSIGISMDERIGNLMHERGHTDLLLEVDDPELEARLLVALDKLCQERERVCESIGRTVVKNLKTMARMGYYFERHVEQRYPEFPLRSELLSWEDYLPPLTPNLQKLIETHA